MTQYAWLYVLAITSMAIVGVTLQSQNDAMAVCQLSHSFDTCHEAMNP